MTCLISVAKNDWRNKVGASPKDEKMSQSQTFSNAASLSYTEWSQFVSQFKRARFSPLLDTDETTIFECAADICTPKFTDDSES